MAVTHFKGPVDSAEGFSVDGVTVIDGSGNLTAAVGSVGTTELANAAVTSVKIDPTIVQIATVTLTPTTIVGTGAGSLGHTAGVVLVAAAPTGYINQFISATLSYTFGTAAYTGGGNDVVIRQGTTAVSGIITAANFLTAAADKVQQLPCLAAAGVLTTKESTLNIFATTAYTQPGTAAGTCKVHVLYRVVPV